MKKIALLSNISERWCVRILLAVTIAAWFFIFRKYLAGAPAMTWHGMDYYFIIKHYMDNIGRGVFPLWDPFGAWGRPDDIDILFIGAYNPFHLIYLALSAFGVKPPSAFLISCFCYYQVGVIGFYLLALRFFRDRWLALLSAVAFLFSSQTFAIFNNYCINLIVIPAIWFFYYLLAFAEEQRKHFFLGLTLSSVFLAITYMPFHFLTMFQPFAFGMVVLFWPVTKKFFRDTREFIRRNRLFAFFCLVFFILAVLPGLTWFLKSAKGDLVLSWRHAGAEDSHTASMGVKTILGSSLIELFALQGLLPIRDEFRFLVTFVSCFIIFLIVIGIINRVNRRQLILVMIMVWLFLVSLGDLTPLHRFLFKHVYFYRLFRNLIYLNYFAMLAVILFAGEQLRKLLQIQAKNKRQLLGLTLYIWGVHASIALFLTRINGVLPVTYLVLGLSALFFTMFYGERLRSRLVVGILLWTIMGLQPLQFFMDYAFVNEGVPWLTVDRFVPRFSFIRPNRENEDYLYRSQQKTSFSSTFFHKGKSPTETQDSSGFDFWKFTGLRWCYDLQQNVAPDVLQEYVKYKFVAYDQVAVIDPKRINYSQLTVAFEKKLNQAFIFDKEGKSPTPSQGKISGEAQYLGLENPFVKVSTFDLNVIRLRTNFLHRKFLVYNDAFHPKWRVWINGQPETIFQTNGAFKGVWLPAGQNEVVFRYGWRGEQILNFLGMGLFMGVLIGLVCLTINETAGDLKNIFLKKL